MSVAAASPLAEPRTKTAGRDFANLRLGEIGLCLITTNMAGEVSGGDCIRIRELELSARIGVPEDERAKTQRLTISITLWPAKGFHDLNDDLEKTVNYSAVAREVRDYVKERSDKLIETLADTIASHLLQKFGLRRVQVELRKFVLTDAKFVAAICERQAND